MFKLRDVLQEVGRRHVARVAVLYAAVAFGALEAADIVFPALGLGAWAIKWLIGLSLVGFPVTLVLAWIYDLTPGGVVRTPATEEGETRGRLSPTGGHPVFTAVLLLASGAVVAMGALYTFRWSHDAGPAPVNAGTPAGELDPLRLVVLPFSDLTEGGGGESFAAGIHEDILNQLMKVGSLEVISRTTALLYRETQKSAREIGTELGVGSILEGSVRKEGNRIRVVAQLIDARTDVHIWSSDYLEEESDVFQVQTRIATEIAGALQAELKPEERARMEVAVPVSGEAYEKYSEAIIEWDRRENRMNAFRAVDLFQEATELDPAYAGAWASLSQARMWLFWNFPGAQEQAQLAVEALDRAVELAPGAAETLLAQGYFYFYGRGDSQEALRYFREAEALKPSDASVSTAMGLILRGQGRWEEAIAAFERARTVDRLSYNLLYTLGDTYLRMRRYESAESFFRLALAADPSAAVAHRALMRVQMVSGGGLTAARDYINGLPRSVSPMIREGLESELAYYTGDSTAAFPRRRGGGEGPGASSPGAEGGGGGLGSATSGVQGGAPRGFERIAILHHLAGRTELRDAYADSLRAGAQETLDAASVTRGPVQTGVIARAHAKLGLAYALLGESVQAAAEGSRAVLTLPVTTDAYEGGDHLRDLVLIYTLIGAPDQAIQELRTALSRPSPLTREDLLLDPVFASLREHPEFGSLQEAVH